MNTHARLSFVFLTSLLLVVLCLPSSAIVYVSTTGNNTTGDSWANAKTSIQGGVDQAVINVDNTVWVAKGTYTENVNVASNILVYGGFSGTEASGFDISGRDFVSSETIAQGSTTSVAVFTANSGCRIDGFTIRNGAASSGAGVNGVAEASFVVAYCVIKGNSSSVAGAGIHASATPGTGKSVVVTACTFQGNTSSLGGAIYAEGMYLQVNGGTTVSTCAARQGGGIYALHGTVSVGASCTFIGNTAQDPVSATSPAGGSIFASDCSLGVSACLFTNESATVVNHAGDLAKGGSIYSLQGLGASVNRCTFINCVAGGQTVTSYSGYGGAIYVEGAAATLKNNFIIKCAARGTGATKPAYGGGVYFHNPGSPQIRNNTFYANEVTPQAGDVSDVDRSYGLGAAVYLNGAGSADVINNIISQSRGTAVVNEGMIVTFNYNVLWHNAGGDIYGISWPVNDPPHNLIDGNIMKDPQYRNKLANDVHILFGSPAKDMGYKTGSPTQDIDGEPRPWPAGGAVDIGADEFVDFDHDGGADNDPAEVSPFTISGGETDTDADLVYTPFDNCTSVANPTQTDSNGDGVGDDCTPLATSAMPRAYFVNGAVISSGDGTSWSTAFKTIQEGIDAADSHNQSSWGRNYEVWVRGNQTYNENVLLWHGVAVYGAWAGTELPTDLPDPHGLRDLDTNQTTIDGGTGNPCAAIAHLPQDRYLDPGVISVYDPLLTVLDSFRLTNGKGELGGGVSNYKDTANVSTCRIEMNTAALGGGAYAYKADSMFGDGLTPPLATLLSGSTFIFTNTATGAPSYAGYGGGVYMERGSPTVFGELIEGNTSFYGGGVAGRRTSCTVAESLIGCGHTGSSNTAQGNGAGDGKGGGIYLGNSAAAGMNELTIVSNEATGGTGRGGGIYVDNSQFTMKNSIVADNDAVDDGGAIYANGTSPVIADPWCYIQYCDFYGNSATQFVGIPDPTSAPPPTSCAQTNRTDDPLFTSPSSCDYTLQGGSPLHGAGDPADGGPNMGALQDEDPPVSVSAAKQLNVGTVAQLSSVIVTAVFDDCFYVEDADRTCGIKVKKYGAPVSVGQSVEISGVVTMNGVEREIMNPSITISFMAPLRRLGPLGMTNACLGGGWLGKQGGVSGWEQVEGVDGSVTEVWGSEKGLNNLGLLVKTWGRVTQVDSNPPAWFTITDGSRVGVKVLVPQGVELPKGGEMAVVTGVSAISYRADGSRDRALRPRTAEDISYP